MSGPHGPHISVEQGPRISKSGTARMNEDTTRSGGHVGCDVTLPGRMLTHSIHPATRPDN